jgi:predicted metal-binding protein
VLLACRKCEKKLKHAPEAAPRKLKKSLKKLAKLYGDSHPLHVVPVSCMKLCPKDAITVCTASELGQIPPRLTIIRSQQDLIRLYKETKSPD